MPPLHSCPLCGHRFAKSGASACTSCPLNGGCNLICCPNCGYQQPDVRTSRLARWLNRWFKVQYPQPSAADCNLAPICTLAQCDPHQPACIRALSPAMPDTRRETLHAHGLLPGRAVTVIQQNPVTIVRIGAAELALEQDLAGLIEVDRSNPPPGKD